MSLAPPEWVYRCPFPDCPAVRESIDGMEYHFTGTHRISDDAAKKLREAWEVCVRLAAKRDGLPEPG